MAESNPSDNDGSLVVAALLLLALGFAGTWIVFYVSNSDPWSLVPWFGAAAVGVIVVAFVTDMVRGRR